ncbi:MAG: winged helix-turn-helix domain-containing protein [Acidobacteriota bacterium]
MNAPAISQYEFGPFRIDPNKRVLLRNGEIIPLTPKCFDTLMALVENSGKLVDKDELIERVWPDAFVEESGLTRNISVLRKVLGDDLHEHRYIVTVPGKGYRFVAPVSQIADETSLIVRERARATITLSEEETGDGREVAAVAETSSHRSGIQSAVGISRRKKIAVAAALTLLSDVGVFALLSGRIADPERSSLNLSYTQLTDQPEQEYFPSLSPDGKFFVYASAASGNWDIYLQRAGGGNPINLTADCPLDDTQPAFSPDGEQIAFRSEREGGGIFIMGATGESVRRATDFGYNPSWSPDATSIACAVESVWNPHSRHAGPSQLWVVSADTGEKRLLFEGDAVQPCWSPRGHQIAFWSQQKGGWRDISMIAADGGEPVSITSDAPIDWSPVWSPDGRYLYFASDRGGSMNVWRVPIEETSGKVLGPPEAVTTPSSYIEHLSFSRDGRRMAYVEAVIRDNIQRVSFDPASETVTVAPAWVIQGSRRATSPTLSPDGAWLAFCSAGDKQEDLFISRSDGTGVRKLTDDAQKDRMPVWSPDGSKLAFYSDRSGKYELWMINADGSGLKRLTHIADSNVGYPVWSPDGRLLAYEVQGKGAFILEATKPWQEQSPQQLPPMRGGEGWIRPFSWSSDGKRLAGWHVRPDGSASGIMIYSLESHRYERITESGSTPVWLSDGIRLLFLNQGKLYLIDSISRKISEVMSLAPNVTGEFALSRDDRLIYFRLSSIEADIWLMVLK